MTKHFINLLSLAMIFLATHVHPIKSEALIRVYSCGSVTGTTCDLYNIFLENETTRFMPSSRNPKQVIKVTLRSSTIPVLTSDICTTFPNIEKFEVQGVGLKRIDLDAFSGCGNLKEIIIYGNSLGTIHPDTFKWRPLLEVISLWNNKIVEIQPELFRNLTYLKTLNLYGNLLTEAPISVFETLTNLKELRLHHNPIVDLDVNALLNVLPNLKEVALQDTDMECDRLKEVIGIFRGAGVAVSTSTWTVRSRSYTVTAVDGFRCLTSEQYQKEMLMTTLPATLAQIKHEIGMFGNASVIDYSSRLHALEVAVEELKSENAVLKQMIELLQGNIGNASENGVSNNFEAKLDHQIRVMDKFLEMQETANKLLWEKVEKVQKLELQSGHDVKN